MPDSENQEVLGQDWGALAGMTPKDALVAVLNMHGELSSENVKLKERLEAIVSGGGESPDKREETLNVELDIEALKGDKAEDELKRYTEAVVDELYKKRRAEDFEADFPRRRAEAKRQAAEIVEREGGNINEFLDQLDKAMDEKKGVSKEQQVDPASWAQAYFWLKGRQSLQGGGNSSGEDVYVERPTGRGGSMMPRESELTYEMPEEKHTHRMFEQQLGQDIPMDEWVAFRDRIKTVDDYYKYLKERKAKRDRSKR